jgi:threonine/homoserine/homoserine lactone efflux protein
VAWATYGWVLVVAVVMVLVPGPDSAVVTENMLAGGRLQGWSSAVGVACSNAVEGVAATIGLGAVVAVQPPPETVTVVDA